VGVRVEFPSRVPEMSSPLTVATRPTRSTKATGRRDWTSHCGVSCIAPQPSTREHGPARWTRRDAAPHRVRTGQEIVITPVGNHNKIKDFQRGCVHREEHPVRNRVPDAS
jgi:hypothetical protein